MVAHEVVVLAARVQLAEHELPVVALFGLVKIDRAAAPHILHLERTVAVARDGDPVPVALARLVDGVGKNLEKRVLATLDAVRAEHDARTLAHPVRAL